MCIVSFGSAANLAVIQGVESVGFPTQSPIGTGGEATGTAGRYSHLTVPLVQKSNIDMDARGLPAVTRSSSLSNAGFAPPSAHISEHAKDAKTKSNGTNFRNLAIAAVCTDTRPSATSIGQARSQV